MPYLYVEFKTDPPIREKIGKVPDDIKLIEENGAITRMQVIIGEEKGHEILSTECFKKIFAETEEKCKITGAKNQSQEAEINRFGSQKAKNFINQLNFRLNSPSYEIQLTTLAILVLQRQLPFGASGYVKSDLKTDIYEIADEDNLLSRMYNSYANGLKALKYRDYVSAYKCFYYIFPDKHDISSDPALNLDLKLLRDGSSHILLGNKKLVERAKELLGEEYVKKGKDGKEYAYIEPLNQKHMDLFIQHMPDIQKYSKEYIDDYIKSYI